MRKKHFFNRWRLIITVLVIAFLGLFLSPTGFTRPLRNTFWQILSPIGRGLRSSLGQTMPVVRDVFQFGRVLKQNSDLIQENLNLQSRLAVMTEMQYENEILKKELGFMKNTDSSKVIPGAIIGQSSGYLKSVIIDKGTSDGLSNGDAVISQGVLVGILTDAGKNNSEVTLITDFNSLVPVTTQDSRATGLLRGGLQGLVVEEVPLNMTIKSGENVVTSGLGGQIPSGILIGKTTEIISKEGEIFQKVAVASPVDFARLEVLFVIKKNE